MITELDDFAAHQTTNPVAHPGPSDRNFYDRYWFGGIDAGGAFTFEVGFGLYPNRFVQDGHVSVVADGVQTSFHGSRRAPDERRDSSVGPLRILVERPLREIRVVLAANETGVECDLHFRATTTPTEEPKNVLSDGPRLLMETSRFTQFGMWEGFVRVDGARIDVRAESTYGTRDRSWGIRPVGEPEAGAPGRLTTPGVHWVWAPLQFDDVCTQYGTFHDPSGTPTQLSACVVPRYSAVADVPAREPGHREMHRMQHATRFAPGTRWPESAELRFETREGEQIEIALEPMPGIPRFHMHGIGYGHASWGHGRYQGELAIHGERWKLADIDPRDPAAIHVHTPVRARMMGPGGERHGVGTLETIARGPHAPSGLTGSLDGAPARNA